MRLSKIFSTTIFKYLIGAIIFVFGVIFGTYSHFFAIHYQTRSKNIDDGLLLKVLNYSDYRIPEYQNQCKDANIVRVKDVLALILEGSLTNEINRIFAECTYGVCTIGISNCNPWDNTECGSEAIKFSLNKAGEIIPSSFGCVQIP